MGSLIPPELTLDCSRPSETWVPKTTGEFLAEVSGIQSASEKVLKLDRYVSRLQDEMKKIDAFKRELPLCMLLLNDAIATVKEELMQCKKSNAEPVLEEFIPLKKNSAGEEKDETNEGGKEKEIVNNSEKMNWMSSVQLWNSDNNYNLSDPKLDSNKKRKEEVINRPAMDDLFPSSKNRARGRAFAPFKGCPNFPVVPMGKEGRDELPGAPSLSLRTPEINNSKDEIYCSGLSSKSSSSRSGSSSATNGQSSLKTVHQQTARKQRRCWSPELHRRFVNALQHLGGAQAATPKQIRELMQVDGLTNDEVKSHLQKYRLHTRKVPPTTNISTNQPVLLGGLWMSQEQCGESSKPSNSQSGSPQGPLHLPGSSRGTSVTGGDSMVDEDDERSESRNYLSGRDDV
ncbi:myb family transcription factor EFM [Sesamum indicum]|uniref:Myb family transcription factor EFM n=1 Tax=Sesamum indicum TaxID=4182 RepID=A0A6I9U1P4_SESIN|nr:myb family transcription factor EFM [Sesamum indicum]